VEAVLSDQLEMALPSERPSLRGGWKLGSKARRGKAFGQIGGGGTTILASTGKFGLTMPSAALAEWRALAG